MDKNSEKDGWRGFSKLCSSLHSSEELEALFDLFFTIEEKENISARYVIITSLLEHKLTQRQIAEQRNVSIAQITRGSNALKIVSPHLKKILLTHLGKREHT